MNRRDILSLSVITPFGLALCSGSAFAQQKSIKDQLVAAVKFQTSGWTLAQVATFMFSLIWE